MIESLIILRRNSYLEALILSAVAVASPGNIRVEVTYIRLKGPSTTKRIRRNPATLA